MNVTIEEVNSIKRRLTVELPEEDARKTRQKILDAYARKARLKGFRPGKAPRGMVAKAYADEIRREVTEELVSEAVPSILKDRGLEPLGAPILDDVDYQDELPLKFSVTLELKPVFDSPDWRGLRLERPKNRVDDETVDKKLAELRRSLSSIKKIEEDRPLAGDDVAFVSYKAFNEAGEELSRYGGGPYNMDLEENRRLEPAFVAGLLGMKAGETKEITVTLPEDVEDRKMAGRPLKMLTTLKEIRIRELPDLDDEFAKDLGLDGVETLAALKERLRGDMLKEEADRADRLMNQQLTKILADLVSIDVPSVMVEREIRNRIGTLRNNLTRNGLDFKKMGVQTAALRERFRPQAEKSVTAALVLDQIGRENQVDVTPEEIEAELAQMSGEYGQPVEVLREFYQSQGLMDTLREGLKISKTLDLIKAEALIEEVATVDPARLGFDLPGGGGDRPAALGAALSADADEDEEGADGETVAGGEPEEGGPGEERA